MPIEQNGRTTFSIAFEDGVWESDLTQTGLAKAAGLSRRTVGRAMQGETVHKPETVIKLATALHPNDLVKQKELAKLGLSDQEYEAYDAQGDTVVLFDISDTNGNFPNELKAPVVETIPIYGK